MTELLNNLRSLVLALFLLISPAATAEQATPVDASRPVADVRAGLFSPHAGRKAPRGQNCPARRPRLRRAHWSAVAARRACVISPPLRCDGRFRSSRCGRNAGQGGRRDKIGGRLRPREAKQALEAIFQ